MCSDLQHSCLQNMTVKIKKKRLDQIKIVKIQYFPDEKWKTYTNKMTKKEEYEILMTKENVRVMLICKRSLSAKWQNQLYIHIQLHKIFVLSILYIGAEHQNNITFNPNMFHWLLSHMRTNYYI